MAFVEGGESLQAAMVRKVVFTSPKPGDEKILARRIEEILADQESDGALSDHELHALLVTGRDKIGELMSLGASPERPEIKKALDYVLSRDGRDPIEKDTGEYGMPLGVALSLQAAGVVDESVVRDAAGRRIDTSNQWIRTCDLCPWTPETQIRTLWPTRHLDKRAEALITEGLQNIVDAINTHSDTYNDPWGYVHVAGVVDHPLGRTIIEKLIPMMVQEQQEDGGWGEHSVKVFRALHRYGLLEELCALPPPPIEEATEQPTPGD